MKVFKSSVMKSMFMSDSKNLCNLTRLDFTVTFYLVTLSGNPMKILQFLKRSSKNYIGTRICLNYEGI